MGTISRRTAVQLLAGAATPRGFTVTLGEPKTLLAAGSLGLNYFPDMPVVALETRPRLRLLVTATISTYLVEGADIEHLTRAEKVMSQGTPGSFDNGYAGIAGLYRQGRRTWYAVYHAEDQQGMPPIPGLIPGFYASIGEAVSRDGGRFWRKLGPALTSSKPKQWAARPGQPDRGLGEPCLAPDRSGKYLYCYYTDHSRAAGRGVQIALARAGLPLAPGRWLKFRDGEFREPGLGGVDTTLISAWELGQSDALMPFVVWSGELRTYIMLLTVNCWREFSAGTPRISGIYVCYSGDGIHWSAPEKLFTHWVVARVGRAVAWHPSILWDAGSTRAGWLIYGYSEHWGHRFNRSGIPHYMVGRRVSFR
jgi:hypothetical protein